MTNIFGDPDNFEELRGFILNARKADGEKGGAWYLRSLLLQTKHAGKITNSEMENLEKQVDFQRNRNFINP